MQDLPEYDSVELALFDIEQAREEADYMKAINEMIKRPEIEMHLEATESFNYNDYDSEESDPSNYMYYDSKEC